MALHFQDLKILAQHHHFLAKKLKTADFFLVGGCTRDLLLGINKQPKDIDLTIAGKPLEIYENIDKQDFSHFITEKFGTITLLSKKKHSEIKYELTPLRAETGYADCRHPEEIFWSNDLLLDAKRRDFTINAIYYHTKTLKDPNYDKSQIINDEQLLKILEKEGFLYLSDQATLIVQKHSYIEQLFPKGICDTDFLYYLLDIQLTGYHYWEEKKAKKDEQRKIHIIIDPYLGIHDLIKRKIVAVGKAKDRFLEDALRILRGIRFPSVLNYQLLKKTGKKQEKILTFDFETETRKALKKYHQQIEHIAKERIKEEIMKAFSEWSPFNCIALLDEAGLLKIIFPALADTKHVEQPIRYHPFDVYAHILLALYHFERLNKDPLARFAMLYHDVGKVGQYEAYGEHLGKEEIKAILSGPLNHRFSSAELAKRDFQALGFGKKEIETICRYIKEHHTPGEILQGDPKNWSKKVRKILAEVGYEKTNTLFDINIADRSGMYNPLQNSNDLSDSYALKKILKQLEEEEGQFTLKDLAIKGQDLMQHFDLTPGKLVWELLQLAHERVLGDIKQRNTPQRIFANLNNHLKNKAKNWAILKDPTEE